jgi:hypothetical protein
MNTARGIACARKLSNTHFKEGTYTQKLVKYHVAGACGFHSGSILLGKLLPLLSDSGDQGLAQGRLQPVERRDVPVSIVRCISRWISLSGRTMLPAGLFQVVFIIPVVNQHPAVIDFEDAVDQTAQEVTVMADQYDRAGEVLQGGQERFA